MSLCSPERGSPAIRVSNLGSGERSYSGQRHVRISGSLVSSCLALQKEKRKWHAMCDFRRTQVLRVGGTFK